MITWLWITLNRIRTIWGWFGFIWQIVVLLGFAGVFLSVGGAIWAAILGVPLPIVIMAGYCTFVGAVYLIIAPFLYGFVSEAGNHELPSRKRPKLNYDPWRRVQKLTLRQAAFLWCDFEPIGPLPPQAQAWLQAFKSAIANRELEYTPDLQEQIRFRRTNVVESDAIVTREQLKAYARKANQDPLFLRDC